MKQKKNASGRIAVTIFVILILLLLAAVFVYLFNYSSLFEKKEKKEAETVFSYEETEEETTEESLRETEKPTAETEEPAEEESITGEASEDPEISEEKARSIVLAYAGIEENSITKYKARIETERGYRVYDIDITAGGFKYDYEVDTETGEIRRYKKEIDGQYEETSDYTKSAHIGEIRAKEIAIAHSGLTETDIWNYKADTGKISGITVYEISFEAGVYLYKFKIHSYSGEVLEYTRRYN